MIVGGVLVLSAVCGLLGLSKLVLITVCGEVATAADQNCQILVLYPLFVISFLLMLWVILRIKVWPIGIRTLVHVMRGDEGAILHMAAEGMKAGVRDAFVLRDYLFFGHKTVFVQSERFVRKVLLHEHEFVRLKVPNDRITSPHTILGSGGMSETWQRIRTLCSRYFRDEQFRIKAPVLIAHVKAAVDARNRKVDDLFQLCNRLIVDAHLMLLLGIENIPPLGMEVIAENGNERSVADSIDDTLTFKFGEDLPSYTSESFRPVMSMLLERFSIAPDDTIGLEAILVEAQRSGKIDSIERLHNIIMFLIALAPSPTVFWTLCHLYSDEGKLVQARGDSNYLSSCIKETLRMYAPVPLMLPRFVNATTKLGHEHLSEGDRVIIPTILIHNDKRMWEEPDMYEPNRFLQMPLQKDDSTPSPAAQTAKEAVDSLERSNSRKRILGDLSDVAKLHASATSCSEKEHKHKKSWQLLRQESKNLSNVFTESKVAVGAHKVQDFRDSKGDKKLDPNRAEKARYFPFGLGTNTCLGQHYASFLSNLVISTVVAHYDMQLEDQKGLLELKHSYQRIKTHVYSFPKHKVGASITPL